MLFRKMNLNLKRKDENYEVNSSIYRESWSSDDGDNSSFISDSSNSDSQDPEHGLKSLNT